MDFKTKSGQRLKEAREREGLSLEALAKLTQYKVKKTALENYEAGRRLLKPETALLLAPHVKVKAAYLVCVAEGDEVGEMTKQEVDLLRNFRALPEKDRNEYARRIEALSLVYREPVPDERLGVEWTAPDKRGKRKQPS